MIVLMLMMMRRMLMMMMMMLMTMIVLMLMLMVMMQIQMNIFHDFSTPYEVKQVAFDLNLSTVCLLVLLVGGRKQRANKGVYYIFCFVVFSFMIMPSRKC